MSKTEKLNITHPELVKALVKPGESIRSQLKAEQCNVLHLTFALAGEVAELWEPFYETVYNKEGILSSEDIENITEELGDIEFFLEGIRQAFDFTVEEIRIAEKSLYISGLEGIISPLIKLTIHAGNLSDAVKRWTIYQKKLDTDLRNRLILELCYIDTILTYIRFYVGLSTKQVKDHNINKLRERYEDLVYSDKAANERADKVNG